MKKKLIFHTLLLSFLLSSCGKNKNKSDCVITKLDLSEEIKKAVNINSDTIDFNLCSMHSIDSLYVYEPYTSIKKLEQKFSCKFVQFNYQDDDTWCLLIIKSPEGKYFYSVVNRYFDFEPLKGEYRREAIHSIRGIKKDSRFTLKFLDVPKKD